VRVQIALKGTSPLVMKNPQMADPDCRWTKRVKEITDKRTNMTEADRIEKGRLQWLGSLYADSDGPYIPATNLRRCLIKAGAMRRGLGKKTERGVIPVGMAIRLDYPGPRDIEKLWLDDAYKYQTMVNSNPSSGKKSMVPSTRPWFPEWSAVADFEVILEAISLDDFRWVAMNAGRVEGLGDNRVNGFGRFSVLVTEIGEF
jgi:hypothetical protein